MFATVLLLRYQHIIILSKLYRSKNLRYFALPASTTLHHTLWRANIGTVPWVDGAVPEHSAILKMAYQKQNMALNFTCLN